MKKLRIALDTLAVQSFATGPVRPASGGTVRAHVLVIPNTGLLECGGSGGTSDFCSDFCTEYCNATVDC